MREIETLQRICQEIIKRMGFEVKTQASVSEDSLELNLVLHKEEAKLLLFQRAEGLNALQHIIRVVVKKDFPDLGLRIILDINNYRKKKLEFLKSFAKELAQEVALTKKAKELPPMSAFERRAIHLALSDFPNVYTESIGQEPNRRVVIKPKV